MLTGVYCHTFDGHVYLAATDGYRLAERRLVPTKQSISAIIPVTALNDVLRVVNDDTAEVKLVFDDNQVRILMDETEITSRLIDGAFETEASGVINFDTIESYAQTGVDYVSVGGLIHQAQSLDLSLKAVIS